MVTVTNAANFVILTTWQCMHEYLEKRRECVQAKGKDPVTTGDGVWREDNLVLTAHASSYCRVIALIPKHSTNYPHTRAAKGRMVIRMRG